MDSKFNRYDTSTKDSATSTNINDGSSTEIINNLDNVKKKVGELNSVLKSITDNNKNMNQNFQSDIKTLSQLVGDIQNVSAKLSEKGQQLQTSNVESKIAELKSVFDNIKNNVNSSEIADAIDEGIRQGLSSSSSDSIKSIIGDVDSGFAQVNDILSKISEKMSENSTKANSFNNAMKEAQSSASQFGHEADSASQSAEQAGAQAQEVFQNQAQQLKDQSETINTLFEHMSKVNQMNANSKEFIDSVMNSITTVAGMDILKQISNVADQTTQAIKNGGLTNEQQANLTQNTSNTLIGSMTSMLNEIKTNNSSDVKRSASNHLLDFIDNSKQMIEGQIRVLDWHSRQEGGDSSQSSAYQKQIEILTDGLKMFQENVENAKKEINSIISSSISEEIKQDMAEFENINNPDPENATRKKVDLDIASRNYGTLASGVASGIDGTNNALEALGAKNGKTGGLFYKYVKTGNLLGNESDLGKNLQTAKRTGVLSQMQMPKWTQDLERAKNAQDREAMQTAMGGMSTISSANADAVINTASGMNLKSGGGKSLSPDDKKILDGFGKSVEEALKNVNATIRAVEEIDPNDETLGKLRAQSEALSDIKNQVDSVKDKSSNLATIFSDIWSGVKKFKNLLAGGLGLLGLGALLNPISFIEKGVGLEEDEGKRRYNMAKSDAYMGADFNPARMKEFSRTLGDEYYSMTSGMIGFDEPMKYRDAMAHGVGGHYGSSPNMAAADMDIIAKNTFAISKVYDISSSTVANMMKTFYKDLGMSANEASYTLVSLAQTANSAGIPVEKYVQTVTGMANSLRESGVDGRQVLSSMNALVGRGLRVEDAQSLVQSQARANTNMAKDYNSSAFFGMMAGQGGDPISLISQGLMSHDEKGAPRGDYYQVMAQRVMQEAMFKGSIGGGLNNGAGLSMFIESLRQRGYTDKDSSMIADAAQKGHTGLVADLLSKADAHKDGGKQQLAEAMVDAKQKIAEASKQLAATQKIEADVTMAEKHVGEAINDYLTGPLSIFREGFANALDTIVTKIGEFAKGLDDFLNSKAGQTVTSTIGDHPFLTAGVVGATAIGLPMAARFAKNRAGAFIKDKASQAATHLPSGGKGRVGAAAGFLGKALPLTLGMAAMGGVAYGAYKLYQMFSSGTAKTQTVNGEQASSQYMSNYSGFMNEWEKRQKDNKPSEFDKQDKDWADDSHTTYGGNRGGDDDQTPPDNGSPNADIPNTGDVDKNNSILEQQIINKINSPTIDLPGDKDSDGKKSGFMSDNGLVATASAFGLATVGANYANRSNRENSRAQQNQESRMLGDLSTFGKNSSKMLRYGAPAVGGLISAGSEIYDYYQHPDRFTGGERFARGALDMIGTVGGGLLGAAAGSAVGPAGTVLGGAAGSAGGQWLANQAKKMFGISDDDGIKREHDRYTQTVDGAKEKYTQNSNSLVNSNDDRAKSADRALREHGMKLDGLTKDQQQYMDNIFNQLKSMGLSDLVASFLAGQQTSAATDKAKNDGTYAAENDGDTHAQYLDYVMTEYGDSDNEHAPIIYNTAQNGSYYWNHVYDDEQGDNFKDGSPISDRFMVYDEQYRQRNNEDIPLSQRNLGRDEYQMLQEYDRERGTKYVSEYGDSGTAFQHLRDDNRAKDFAKFSSEAIDGDWGKQYGLGLEDRKKWATARALQNKANETGDGSGNGKTDDAEAIRKKYNANPPSTTDNKNGQIAKIINKAKSLVGSSYSDYDCSLLTQTAYAAGGITLARQADDQYGQMKEAGALSTDFSKIKPGALLFREGTRPGKYDIGHTGIYIGNGKFIHSGGSDSGVTEQDFDASKWQAYGNAEGLGATGSLPDNYTPGAGDSVGSNTAQTPEEALNNAMKGRDALLTQLGKMGGGLSNAELLKDKVATGQLIIDGTTALSANGKSLTLAGVRKNFRMNSGEKDFDRYGYGLNGAFTGDGKVALNKDGKASTGPLEMNKVLDAKYEPKPPTYHAYKNADQTLLAANDKAQAEKDAINNQNNAAYKENQRKIQEAQDKATEENKAENQEKVKIEITAVDNSGDKVKKQLEDINKQVNSVKAATQKTSKDMISAILAINSQLANR
jgi:cell wall-associated NlpC family hydrolase/uncharacterized coiled-coil DUF342 family protein